MCMLPGDRDINNALKDVHVHKTEDITTSTRKVMGIEFSITSVKITFKVRCKEK